MWLSKVFVRTKYFECVARMQPTVSIGNAPILSVTIFFLLHLFRVRLSYFFGHFILGNRTYVHKLFWDTISIEMANAVAWFQVMNHTKRNQSVWMNMRVDMIYHCSSCIINDRKSACLLTVQTTKISNELCKPKRRNLSLTHNNNRRKHHTRLSRDNWNMGKFKRNVYVIIKRGEETNTQWFATTIASFIWIDACCNIKNSKRAIQRVKSSW